MATVPTVQTPPQQRLRSLDALRGFDMFWIIGGDALADALSKMTHNDAIRGASLQFIEHVDWEGFRYYDMIFPLFLFIIGVALPFSIGRRLEAGADRGALMRKVLARTAIMILIGLVYNGLLRFDGIDNLRFFGVLQRLALGYCAASFLMIYTKWRTQLIVAISLLLVYWALMEWMPVPGVPHGTMTQMGNWANYVDRLFLSRHQMYESYGDPEGPVSTIPAISTALMGLLAGHWLRTSRPEGRKSLGLAVAGLVLIGVGLLWSPFFPIIKKIWTSSYALVAGGMSLELLALFHWVIDVKGWWKWSFPFIVIGMNPLLIYVLSAIVDFGAISVFFLGGLGGRIPNGQAVLLASGVIAVKWLLLYFLYRQRVFVRI